MPCQKNQKPSPTVPSKYMSPLPDFWLPVFWKNQFRTTIELPTREKYPQVEGSTAILTGSNTGLGFEASKQLLSLGLSHLVMGVRSLEKGKVAAEKLRTIAPSARIDVWQLDMQSYDSIQNFARRCDAELSRIDFVILNAGLSPNKFELVPGTGHEVGIQVNHLSTALLTILLIPILKTKASGQGPPHLTTVNSLTAHLCKFPNKDERPLLASFDDPKITPWSSQERYGVSKLLNQLFLARLCEKVNPDDLIINMVDPGLTKGTNLGGHHEMGGVAGALAGAFFAVCGRPLDRGAASYTNAVYGHGKKSHGCFLMSCEIAPLAGWFYTHGDVLVDQVWDETLEELDFAGVKGIARINNPTDPRSISDATIMVVVILGLAAEMLGDRIAAENHAAGMARIVDLRGGIEMLRFDNPRLPAKVCRVDIGLALRFGCRPVFFDKDISWSPYLSNQGLVRRKKKHLDANHDMVAFLKTLDPRLSHVWRDLEEFAKLSNIASQTGRKLQPNIFSESMVSTLYRLLALSPESASENTFRLGMMTLAASIFFRWRDMKQRQANLDDSFRDALRELQKALIQPPTTVILWLLVIWRTNSVQGGCDEAIEEWFLEVMGDLGIYSWPELHKVLKSVLWVDCLFDASSKRILAPILEEAARKGFEIDS
ncbi:hypothetical protein BFJ72_g1222 [Fusarium proliferatum]|uniref:Uncharacterized protein n=1 Tax=Gibberella intermedia TaxID=948311 RepID=A0A420U7J2_GIBIN|nr:hypothetical protein BFJ72_g1222 [Fusarium proliferatum]